jgi:D-3-phosphoglycerate dehydrogenase
MHSFSKDKINVLLLEGVHPRAVENFKNQGYTNVHQLQTALQGEELAKQLQNVHILGIRSRTQLTDDVLKATPKLMAVGCFCIGTNQVELANATIEGIPVFNAPFSNTRSVAELVLGEMVMLMRGIPAKNMAIHLDGTWLKSAAGSFELRGKTLGIIGYGHIGMQVAGLAENFGMQVLYYDIENKLALGNARSVQSLNKLLELSDIITLHVPETPQTQNMMGIKEFQIMKKGSHLINASRGSVVDIPALTRSLKDEHLAGAAIDVFPKEPKGKEEKLSSELIGLHNVILTPHIGGSTKEAQENIAIEVSEKLIKYSDNGSTTGAVNFPEVHLPNHENSHRILHIHQNQPGMLNALNQVFEKINANISGQYLQTHNGIGYVVTDIDASDKKIDINAFKNIEGTIKTRILY